MPYLDFKRIKGHRYVYVRHQVRLDDKFVRVHLGYIGPLDKNKDHDIEHIAKKKQARRPLSKEDKNTIQRIMDRYHIAFDPAAVRTKAEALQRVKRA